LLHYITRRFDDGELTCDARTLCRFFRSVGHVLPCIYCRRSFQKYYAQLPLRPYAKRGKSFEWYFRIHNLINDKLRKQGYIHTPNPSLSTVKKIYDNYHPTYFVGWNFLYSICYHYPARSEISERRHQAYITFFNQLKELYPVHAIREKYARYLNRHPVNANTLQTGLTLTKWLYGFEKRVNPRCCSFKKKCTVLDRYAVKKCVNKSCRKNSATHIKRSKSLKKSR
jgi:hypothetical protein